MVSSRDFLSALKKNCSDSALFHHLGRAPAAWSVAELLDIVSIVASTTAIQGRTGAEAALITLPIRIFDPAVPAQPGRLFIGGVKNEVAYPANDNVLNRNKLLPCPGRLRCSGSDPVSDRLPGFAVMDIGQAFKPCCQSFAYIPFALETRTPRLASSRHLQKPIGPPSSSIEPKSGSGGALFLERP
jgi:hypothetical protein